METGYSDGEVELHEISGEPFTPEDYPYILATMMTLDHHVKHGQIEPAFESDEQRDTWVKHQAGELMKSEYEDVEDLEKAFEAQLFAIPFRLTHRGHERHRQGKLIHVPGADQKTLPRDCTQRPLIYRFVYAGKLQLQEIRGNAGNCRKKCAKCGRRNSLVERTLRSS